MPSEVESVLRKKLADTEKQYEEKLATFSVFNDALQKENTQLREQLERDELPHSATDQEVQELKLEFTRRMATVERDNARLKEKNEQLRAKMGSMSQGGSSAQARLREREEYITSLQREGEGLARKNGELEGNLRKVRTSLKEGEAERARLLSRLKQQDETLEAERSRLEKTAAQHAQQHAQLQREYESLQQTAMDQIQAALKESASATEAAVEKARQGGDSALQDALHREADLNALVERLRDQAGEAQARWGQQEESLRREIQELDSRLLAQEGQISEMMADASDGNRPLLRQMEAMAGSARKRDEAHALAERKLMDQIEELQSAVREASEAERDAQDQLTEQGTQLKGVEHSLLSLQDVVSGLEMSLSSQQQRCQDLVEQLEEAAAVNDRLQADLDSEKAAHNRTHADFTQRLWQAREQVASLRSELDAMKASKELQALQHADVPAPSDPEQTRAPHKEHRSEQRKSSTESEHEHPFREESVPDESNLEARLASLFRSGEVGEQDALLPKNGYGSSKQVDTIESESLKARVSAAEALAERAQDQLYKACQLAEQYQSEALKQRESFKALQELKAQHELALELLGERNERVDSLEDDIQDMKHIFHTQLSSLVDELNSLRGV